ncbi:CDP-diacylglycerol--glycerol-3-phosphate 3-phosphatidyltransferase [Corynebacterium coyleae]|uniref:Phosphatidylinositol phosphate synthase n=1 Tax=Corynebacterium coyleae TaxID=53374 RepID=A0ABX8KV65_9CORY|nr:CDP-alcohol phosphatidyltransferase family protein [Corynebacterium coyleae]MDK6492608.1 CDP-alcohol phosphatidyltransferase family protein [Corynebacterium coyleae]PLA28491.1 CDP-alcohol phosphatidyltransferase family protein [Corynebacterium coyleae]QXB18513.1 CDP-alcohol phosphatidyltransferase family protein [Corynebacterium coyleae]WJY80020.1 CDP-diacylglycerol--inositol 3-phosphatidyltransferase [Corynebacterium coyleae]SEC02572.1 CDP-diacylglycerol--glycerol-3-phosphate 3-phosphatidy
MLSVHGRKPAAVVVEPVAKGLLKAGVTPNMITLAGTIATMLAMMVLIPTDHLVWAAVLSTIFAACDMVDGTMARLRGGGTAFGATLDASCDRLTDGALFGSIAMWMVYVADLSAAHVAACLAVLVLSQAISYIKARAEAGGISVVGGLIERPERLILALGGLALEGFGVPNAVVVSIWLLLAGSLFTVVQRLVFAARDDQANAKMAPPAGA